MLQQLLQKTITFHASDISNILIISCRENRTNFKLLTYFITSIKKHISFCSTELLFYECPDQSNKAISTYSTNFPKDVPGFMKEDKLGGAEQKGYLRFMTSGCCLQFLKHKEVKLPPSILYFILQKSSIFAIHGTMFMIA